MFSITGKCIRRGHADRFLGCRLRALWLLLLGSAALTFVIYGSLVVLRAAKIDGVSCSPLSCLMLCKGQASAAWQLEPLHRRDYWFSSNKHSKSNGCERYATFMQFDCPGPLLLFLYEISISR